MKALALFGWALCFVVSWILGMIAALPVFVMGLVVSAYVLWPLTLFSMASASALCVHWIGNPITRDRRRSDLLVVVLIAQIVAFVLDLISLLLVLSPDPVFESLRSFVPPAIPLLAIISAVLALSTTVTACGYRSAERNPARDEAISGALVVGGPVAIFLIITLSCGVMYCGP